MFIPPIIAISPQQKTQTLVNEAYGAYLTTNNNFNLAFRFLIKKLNLILEERKRIFSLNIEIEPFVNVTLKLKLKLNPRTSIRYIYRFINWYWKYLNSIFSSEGLFEELE
jgi:hypothetical protein